MHLCCARVCVCVCVCVCVFVCVPSSCQMQSCSLPRAGLRDDVSLNEWFVTVVPIAVTPLTITPRLCFFVKQSIRMQTTTDSGCRADRSTTKKCFCVCECCGSQKEGPPAVELSLPGRACKGRAGDMDHHLLPKERTTPSQSNRDEC